MDIDDDDMLVFQCYAPSSTFLDVSQQRITRGKPKTPIGCHRQNNEEQKNRESKIGILDGRRQIIVADMTHQIIAPTIETIQVLCNAKKFEIFIFSF